MTAPEPRTLSQISSKLMAEAPRFRVIDIETSHPSGDLKRLGASLYARDARIDCAAWEVLELLPDGRLKRIHRDRVIGQDINRALNCVFDKHRPEDFIVAHNAIFELLVFAHSPAISPAATESWICTMMMARYLNLPAGLDSLSQWLLGRTKDTSGKLMLQQRLAEGASGQGSLVAGRDLDTLAEYCATDVDLTSRCLAKMLPAVGLHGRFRRECVSHLKVLLAGLPVDVPMLERASETVSKLLNMWDARSRGLCGHKATEKGKIKRWLEDKHACRFMKSNSEAAIMEAGRASGSDAAMEVCKLTVAASAISLRKWGVLLERHDYGRLRDHLVYCGTAPGRYSSFGAQVHNFPNPKLSDNGRALEAASKLDADYMFRLPDRVQNSDDALHAAQVLKLGLRRSVRAKPGCKLVMADFAQIELRVLMLLCGLGADLKALHEGYDFYYEIAREIFAVGEAKPWQRSVGKQAVLAMGYGMGVHLFTIRLEELGVPDAQLIAQRASDAYHARWPEVKALWRYCSEVWSHGEAKGRGWSLEGRHLDKRPCYIIKLPSGRPIVMWDPVTGEGARATCDGRERHYPGYLIAQNLTQAIARDILSDAIISIQANEAVGKWGRVAGHVHDEIIIECDATFADDVKGELIRAMETPPEWMPDLLLKAEGRIGYRWW